MTAKIKNEIWLFVVESIFLQISIVFFYYANAYKQKKNIKHFIWADMFGKRQPYSNAYAFGEVSIKTPPRRCS